MATCKDCIHYDVCTFNLTGHENEKCAQFLDKADVVEVVRCKDCKKRYVPCYCALWYLTVNGRELFLERGDYFFCSHGERMSE